jgi:hypothetical protein
MLSLGLEPATFRLVAQCLKQIRYRVPRMNSIADILREETVNVTHTHTQPLCRDAASREPVQYCQ